MFEKSMYTVAIGTAVLVGVIAGAYWWSGRVPGRPKTVAADAVFLWAPAVGVPGPRRGWWLSCSEDGGRDRCRISTVDGKLEYEGEFVVFGDKGHVLPGQLKIDAKKSGENWVSIAGALVPLVVLENGKVLLPAAKYEEGARLLQPMGSDH